MSDKTLRNIVREEIQKVLGENRTKRQSDEFWQRVNKLLGKYKDFSYEQLKDRYLELQNYTPNSLLARPIRLRPH